MKAMADHTYHHFMEEKAEGYPGHPEVELALMRLYHTTKDARYKELAAHFVDVRGVDSEYFKKESETRGWTVWNMNPEDKEYAQNEAPVREQKKAVGHAVRAVYLYTAMADLAAENKDESLIAACNTLWDNITNQRMYVTGGIGSTNIGEAFTKDYHLPNDTVYAETCASIGLMFFASRMLKIEKNSKYADVMERALYNTVLAGMQLDGKKFFYVNPLEVIPGISGEAVTHKHDLPQRPKWFGCACCPPNVARTLTSIAEYAWSEEENILYSNLYVGGTLKNTDSRKMTVHVETKYPYDGKISYRMEGEEGVKAQFTLAIRIPDWCTNYTLNVDNAEKKNGYVYIEKEFRDGDEIILNLDMTPSFVYANPAVAADSGKAAIMRGPLIYCVEGVDNEGDVLGLSLSEEEKITVCDYDADMLSGIVPLKVAGYRTVAMTGLYTKEKPKRTEVEITAIPYYAWGNRGLNEMRVWLPVR
jgi:DUF1680 family protein